MIQQIWFSLRRYRGASAGIGVRIGAGASISIGIRACEGIGIVIGPCAGIGIGNIFAALVNYPIAINYFPFFSSVLAILFIKYIFKGAIGSLWCLISVYMWLYAYFIFGIKEPVKLTNIFTN